MPPFVEDLVFVVLLPTVDLVTRYGWSAELSENEPRGSDIAVDASSGVPIWLQLRNQIIFLIDSRRFGPGYRLPTVREMAVELGVNYNTVGKVYQGLERDGYIWMVLDPQRACLEIDNYPKAVLYSAQTALRDEQSEKAMELRAMNLAYVGSLEGGLSQVPSPWVPLLQPLGSRARSCRSPLPTRGLPRRR